MAEIKKAADTAAKAAPEVKETAAPAVKAPEKTAEVKTAKAEVKEEKKAPAKKETKTTAKKTTTAKKATTKKTTAKKTETATTKKAPAKKAAKQVINLQFAGKSYSVEDLQKIAADVWKYDLHKADEAYTSLELYVKPEESVAYYVFNGEITGSFFI